MARWRLTGTISSDGSTRSRAASTITRCASRYALRSVIALLPGRHAGREAALVQHHAHLVAHRHLPRAPHDRSRRREREAVAAAQHGQRRERVEPAGDADEAVTPAVQAARERAVEPSREVVEAAAVLPRARDRAAPPEIARGQ